MTDFRRLAKWGEWVAGSRLGRYVVANLERLTAWKEWVAGGRIGEQPSLRDVDLSNAFLRNTLLTCADLSDVDLSDVDLSDVGLTNEYLRNTLLVCADLRDADLRDARLAGLCLTCADLSGADLSGASLYAASLHGADLSGAKFGGADLRRASLSSAGLTGAMGLPPAPKIDALDAHILNAVTDGDGKLEMGNRYTCETTHCIAGWAIALAGEEGQRLEARFGPSVAGALIYQASTGHVPNFCASNEDALRDLRKRAQEPPMKQRGGNHG